MALALLGSAALVFADDAGLRSRAEDIYGELQRRVEDTSLPVAERAACAERISQLSTHPDLELQLRAADSTAALILSTEEALRLYRFDLVPGLTGKFAGVTTPDARRIRYRWLFVTENLPVADSLTQAELRSDSTDPIALWPRGELLFRLVRYAEAETMYVSALQHASTPRQQAEIRIGLARVYEKRKEYQRALDTLTAVMTPEALTSDVLFQAGLALIDLSRVGEAVDMFEEAARWNPNSELAHYFLGNGFARSNYTQLREKYPVAYGDSTAIKSLQPAIAHYNNGEWEFAHVAALAAQTEHNQSVEPLELLGAIAWTGERMDEAAEYFRTALERCPEYGRAHNGLAKALEGKRLRVNVHRAEDSLKFAARGMPQIDKIEEYVANWKSLSPRHQKQVALSVEPWRLYVPLLAETGHRHYIKPLYERLSQVPGMETIKDQRISYDSRLWDDVRGCGGYITTTGIEDVERSIYASYNTVLHEMTHQVHGMFPPEDAQRIQDRYQEGRNLEAKGTKVFMSQYQAASAWEYFAEGANAYYSPQRDAYDIREIVRERLFALDTTLARMVEYYATAPNLDACYPVAFVNAAEDQIEQRDLTKAVEYARKSYTRAPRAEVVLGALSNIYSLKGEDRRAESYADSLLTYFPQKARSYTASKTAHFFDDGDAAEAIRRLQVGLGKVDTTEEKSLRAALGDALWYAGQYDPSAEQYRTILARYSKDSGALWGLGLALGEEGHFAESDSAFKLALLEQSGVTDMRLDYARILLKSNKLSEAEMQIHEAEILSPDDPSVKMTKGQLAETRGDTEAALRLYDQSIKAWPYDRLPQILRVKALYESGKNKQARRELKRLEKAMKTDVPAWEYHLTRASYTPAYLWPSFQREIVSSLREEMK